MQIDADLDGGSIEVLDDSDPASVSLALAGDNAADFKQWFYFRARDVEDVDCTFQIVNAGMATYPNGWEDYSVSASYDGERWFHVDTMYDDDVLTFRHTPEHDEVLYACYPPYATERCEALLARADASSRADVFNVGESVDGRPMRVVAFGDRGGPGPCIWIIAHQHPGETMAGWFAEGLILRLLDASDPVANALLENAVIHIVPRMNPDGSARGNHRTNAVGSDLNREWLYPSFEASPEVASVRLAMEETGVDLFIDVHGDESIPYLFGFGTEGVPSYTERLQELEERFFDTLDQIDDDFQREEGYQRDPPGAADLRIASQFVAQRFDCLSIGLEMPFKDNDVRPAPGVGWSPERCVNFAGSVLEAVLHCLDALR
jgi:murein tripeptide amidase MpaA